MNEFPSAAFDRWLTTDPRDADQAAFENWCDAEGVDYDDPTAWDRFEEAMEDAAWDAAERAAEDRADRDW